MKESRAVLFLDIDGVLISERFLDEDPEAAEQGGLCPRACSQLRRLLDAVPELRIVVSSSHRLGKTENELFDWLATAAGLDRSRLVGRTPHLPGESRAREIEYYLSKNPGLLRWAVVDDHSVSLKSRERVLLTDPELGLTEEDTSRLVAILAAR